MDSRFFRQFAPLGTAIIGIGVGYLSAGTSNKEGIVSTVPQASNAAPEITDAFDSPYPATMEGVLRAAAENTGSRREWLVEVLTAKMTAADLEAVAMRVESLLRSEQYALMPRIMAAWVKLDPAAAERWIVLKAPTFRKGSNTFLETLDAFAKQQPLRAFAILDQLPPGTRRERLAGSAATELAKINPKQAAEFAAAVVDPGARKLAEAGVLTGLAHADPLAALARLKDMPPERRSSIIGTALNRLFAQSPANGFAELAKLPPSEQSQHMYQLAWRYAERSPDIFAEFVEKNAKEDNQGYVSYIANYAASAMANTDPAKAMAWVQRLPESARNQALGGVLNTWSQKDPSGALAWALKNKPENNKVAAEVMEYYDDGVFVTGSSASTQTQNRNVSAVLHAWSQSDPAAMKAWANTAEGAPYRQEVAEYMLSSVVAEGRVDEARAMLNQLPKERQTGAIQRAVNSMAYSNPAKAAEWLLTLPADSQSPHVYQSIVQNWASSDIAASAAWVEKLPQGPARDSASIAYAQRISGADPSAAVEWALGTAEGDQRKNALSFIYTQWLRKDANAANDWLTNEQGLSADEVAHFQQFRPPQKQ